MMYGRVKPPTFSTSHHRRHLAHRCACANSRRTEAVAVEARYLGRRCLTSKRSSTLAYSNVVRVTWTGSRRWIALRIVDLDAAQVAYRLCVLAMVDDCPSRTISRTSE